MLGTSAGYYIERYWHHHFTGALSGCSPCRNTMILLAKRTTQYEQLGWAVVSQEAHHPSKKIIMACLISKIPSPSVFSTEGDWSRLGASAQYNGVPLLRKLIRSKGTTAWLDNPGSQGSQKPARFNTTQTGQNNGQLPHWLQPA